MQHIEHQGKGFFEEICARDLEGIVAKRKLAAYKSNGLGWKKIKNPNYSSTTYGSPCEGSVSPRKWRRGWRRSPLPHSLEQIVPAFSLSGVHTSEQCPVPGELLFRVTTGHVTLLRPKHPADTHLGSSSQCR